MGDWRRQQYSRRVRALEWRVERLRSERDVVRLFKELDELRTWWYHADTNAEALRIIATCWHNAAWERARRRFEKANGLYRRNVRLAMRYWQEGESFLVHDWRVMFRREPTPEAHRPHWYVDDS